MAVSKRLLTVVALVACTIPLVAQRPTGQVTGVLIDSVGPMPGATVTIDTASPLSTVTDTRGRFILLGIPDGTFELKAKLAGFDMPTWTVTIKNGEVIDLGVTQVKMKLGTAEPNLAAMGIKPGEVGVGVTTTAGNFSLLVDAASPNGARPFLAQVDRHAFDGGQIQPLVVDNGSAFKGVAGLVFIGSAADGGAAPVRIYLVHGALATDAAGQHALGRLWHWPDYGGDVAARIASAPFSGEAFVTPVSIKTLTRIVFLAPGSHS